VTDAYLGVDAGGTHTCAVVATGDGRSAIVQAGPANWTTLGPDRSSAAIADAASGALAEIGLEAGSLTRACVALAGYYPRWHQKAAHTAIQTALPEVPVRLVTDLVAAWAGATHGEPGIVLAAGTGAVAYGKDSFGSAGRAGGWGPLFGDEGGGYWIGIEALRAVARSLDGRGPATSLGQSVWLWANASDPAAPADPATRTEQALRAVYRDAWPRDKVAFAAPFVARHAAAGDRVSAEILKRAAAELGALVLSVAQQLRWGAGPIPVYGVGGVFEAGPPLLEPLERWLAAALPTAHWRAPRGSPVEGALRLAREVTCPTP
jgi:N-acetylglucosamine kinase-like BadF-type ATPase